MITENTTKIRISDESLDAIIALQMTIARAGELERLSWWNVDATDIRGGGDFFTRLVGESSGIAAIDTAIAGARHHEEKLLSHLPNKDRFVTLFHPDFELHLQLRERWNHLTRNTDTIAGYMASLMDHHSTFDRPALESLLKSFPRPPFEISTIGLQIKGTPPGDPLVCMQQLAALLLPIRDKYPLPFYQNAS
jgi:hypothetical protein